MAEDNGEVDIARLVADGYQSVYRYAYRLSGSATEAEDLTQQVYLIAHGNLGQLRSLDSVKSWLFTILRNHFLRQRQNSRRIPTTSIPVNLDDIPEQTAYLAEIEPEQLQNALNRLPEAYRLILGMFYFEECSYKEIAESLQLPLGTVMSRLARAKSALRAVLLESNEKRSLRKKKPQPLRP